ncbi:PIG-L deacetylase family protein [Streptomyces ficellus]|uniref:PIG-L family deacetylase n=1 Tax=Streptomyces ficellus TaxID=1977088 RepID=A0A6I6F2V4_9ACTN|nr:PIG-L family deacetylase [Streptomyces ficellus]QGV78000.1 PIG-L family deacetylase [Streptomyces ficellus]
MGTDRTRPPARDADHLRTGPPGTDPLATGGPIPYGFGTDGLGGDPVPYGLGGDPASYGLGGGTGTDTRTGTAWLTAAVGEGRPLVVLSPHLDDAVLSCGALMAHARHTAPVTVVTVFTEAGPPPYTLSARGFLHQNGARDAGELYASRRAEDRAVLERLDITWHHLGLPEGLFRRKPDHGSRRPRRLGALLPESAHIYPTYRRHLAAGRLSRFDTGTLMRVLGAVAEQWGPDPRLLLAPLAVGGHADHLLVRTAAELSRRPVVYYSDFPYNQQHSVDAGFRRRNAPVPAVWRRGLAGKPDLIRAYRTQAGLLFPSGQIPVVPEVYVFPGGPP